MVYFSLTSPIQTSPFLEEMYAWERGFLYRKFIIKTIAVTDYLIHEKFFMEGKNILSKIKIFFNNVWQTKEQQYMLMHNMSY